MKTGCKIFCEDVDKVEEVINNWLVKNPDFEPYLVSQSPGQGIFQGAMVTVFYRIIQREAK